MKTRPLLLAVLLAGTIGTGLSTATAPAFAAQRQNMAPPMQRGAMEEARALLADVGRASGRQAYTPTNGVRFKASDNVYVKSALAIDFTYRKANVTLPLFRGISPKGQPVYYIITDASDFEVARAMGLNYAQDEQGRRNPRGHECHADKRRNELSWRCRFLAGLSRHSG
jgi:hypothetical protein